MRSENERINYRSRFDVVPYEKTESALEQIVRVLWKWAVGKERRRGDGAPTALQASLLRKDGRGYREFLNGELSVPAGYKGGINEKSMAAACTGSLFDDTGERIVGWVFEYDEPDGRKQDGYRHWHTSIGISVSEGDVCTVNIRNTYYMLPGYIGRALREPYCTVPNFVSTIFQIPGYQICVGDTPVQKEVEYLDLNTFQSRFVDNLLSDDRELPLLLVTTDGSAALPVWDEVELARMTMGLANVYVLDWRDRDIKSALFDLFERGTAAYNYRCGASTLRVYQPHIDLSNFRDCRRHRFFNKEKIDELCADFDGGLNHMRFVSVINRCLTQSITRRDSDLIDMRDIAWREGRREANRLRVRMEELKKRSFAQPDAKVENLKQDLREWQALAEEYSKQNYSDADHIAELENELEAASQLEVENKRLEYELGDAREELADLKGSVKALSEFPDKVALLPEWPSTLEGLLKLTESLWGDKVAVLSKAYSSARTFAGKDLTEQWRILVSIPTKLWPLYFDEDGIDISSEYQAKTGFELALTEGGTTKNDSSIMSERRMVYKGEELTFVSHIKSKTKKPKEMLRVYYAVSRKDEKIVIGSCGEHMRTAGTRKLK